ncbi:hypothetical protein [Marichromatium purpuratum]|uniref:hypothetical protein n=1 Tax=Marichromatium purpuratum TaxID=37487 RepID=UPI00021E7170|nr:hypothetical protein [Marichromatium purpuratum]
MKGLPLSGMKISFKRKLILILILFSPHVLVFFCFFEPVFFWVLFCISLLVFLVAFFSLPKIASIFLYFAQQRNSYLEFSLMVVRCIYWNSLIYLLSLALVGFALFFLGSSDWMGVVAAFLAAIPMLLYAWRRFPFSAIKLIAPALNDQVILDRNPLYTLMWHLTQELSSEDRIVVTTLECAPTDYVEESLDSKLFMERWQEKVREGVFVKHVIRLFDEPQDLKNLDKRLSDYKNLPNYQIGVMLAPPSRPFVDLYIVSGKYAAIFYATSAAEPYLMRNALFVTGEARVNSIEKWFTETLWSYCEPLKDTFKINYELFGQIKRRVEVLGECDGGRFWTNLPDYFLARPIFLPSLVAFIKTIQNSASMREEDVPPEILCQVESQLRNLAQIIADSSAIAGRRFSSSYEALKEVCRPQVSLQAVSVIDNETYWLSRSGQAQMNFEKELSKEGVAIERVCVVAGLDRLSQSMQKVLLELGKYMRGASLMLADRNSVNQASLPANSADFAIIDKKCVIVDQGGSVGARYDREIVSRYQAHFNAISEVSMPFVAEGVMKQEEYAERTVVELDLVAYSSLARTLEENLDTSAVAKLNLQIVEFVDDALRRNGEDPREVVLKRTGDGAILAFTESEKAHQFAESFFEIVGKFNEKKTAETSAQRRFRMGAATGKLSFMRLGDGTLDFAGTTIANAVRLEAASNPGCMCIDLETFSRLPNAIQEVYECECTVPGKRDELFHARCRRFAEMGEAPSIILEAEKKTDKKTVLDILEKLEREDQIDILTVLLEMPVKDRPARTLNISQKRVEIFKWAASQEGCGLSTLQAESDYLWKKSQN